MPVKIIATNYISLYGVIEDPVGIENSGLGDWTGPFHQSDSNRGNVQRFPTAP